jgi:hypothetical protein
VGVLEASISPPKERCAVSNDNVFKLIQPGCFDDQLTGILRQGARTVLAQAVEAEVADFLAQHAGLETEDGHQRIVRHGHLPKREVMTGISPVAVRQPRVRDRETAAGDPGIRFTPAILPPYLRRWLSPTAIARLRDGWRDDYDGWQKRDLSAKRYVYAKS